MFTELANVPKRVLTGMVKADPADSHAVLISAGPGCTEWTSIPESVVVDYEFVATAQCGDHSHPVVHLYLRDPATPEEQAFLLANAGAGLRTLSTAVAAPAMMAPVAPRLATASVAGYRSDCVYDVSLGWVIRGTTIPCPG